MLSQNIPAEQNQNISSQNWLSGIYFITLSNQSQQLIKTQKLIIEN
ncbi:MAG: T9SS type A sorting domain-containing protein [Bacteroidetes bacterium]|nr:T9SS type A sorting domain-containing protein [Bacteroidota bacterium]